MAATIDAGGRQPLWGLLIPAVALLGWEAAFRFTTVQSDTLAPPSAVVATLIGSLLDGTLVAATRDTLLSVLGGLAAGGAIGLVMGTLLGALPRMDKLFVFPLEIIRPIPSVALIPVVMIIAGFGYAMEISIVSFACIWPVLMTTRAAIAEVEPRLVEVAQVLGLGFFQRAFKILIPAALPRIFVGFRLGAGIALIVAVTVEIAANPIGLGYAIMMAQQALKPALMLAILLWIGILGFGLNKALVMTQRRFYGYADLTGAPT